jgi:CRP/FNR family transcriptional regulator, anaerobic regulatory protein
MVNPSGVPSMAYGITRSALQDRARIPFETTFDSCRHCWLRPACVRRLRADDGCSTPSFGMSLGEVQRGKPVFRKGEPFHSLFVVLAGCFKSVALSYEGQEKIVALHLPGEIFGLPGIATGRYAYDAIAVERAVVCVIPYVNLAALLRQDGEFQQRFIRVLSCARARHQVLASTMADLPAERRIALLLLRLSERYARWGRRSGRFPFVMTRVEAARYSGLAHETVSRVLSDLRARAIIRPGAGWMEILSRDALEQIAGLEEMERCNCPYFGC